MSLKSYRDQEVWQEALVLAQAVYALTERFPTGDRGGLTGQARRAAAAIPAQVAQGYGRARPDKFLKHLSNARGLLSELESHLILAERLKWVTRKELAPTGKQCRRVGDLLARLLETLGRRRPAAADPGASAVRRATQPQ